MSKMPKLPVYNNNDMKHKPLRRNMPSSTPIVSSPTATDVFEKKKKHFVSKYKNVYIKHDCTDKFHKLLHKLDKNNKLDKNHNFTKSNKTLGILNTKSNMKLTTLHVKGVNITLDPNTMKSNSMANSSSPCPSSPKAMILRNIFHVH